MNATRPDFSDLSRCYTHTIVNERLRLRYVELERAIVAEVQGWYWRGPLSVDTIAERLNADPMVVSDEARQAVAHGHLRWERDQMTLRPAIGWMPSREDAHATLRAAGQDPDAIGKRGAVVMRGLLAERRA